MPLNFKIDQPNDLTIFTATGDVTYTEAINTLGAYTRDGYSPARRDGKLMSMHRVA